MQQVRPEAEIEVRDACDDDGPALLFLWRELMDFHQQLDDRFALAELADDRFRAYIDVARNREDYHVRVASRQGEVVGFVVACVLPNSPVYRTRWIGYINDICVHSAHRRRGIGATLVRDAVGWMKSVGAESFEVYVAQANGPARTFWRRMGGREYLERLSITLDPEA